MPDWESLRAQQEKNGRHFDQSLFLEMRRRTRQTVHAIAASIHPGMTEEEAHRLAKIILKQQDMFRGWHPLHIRFGNNTLKNFGEPSEPGVRLAEQDIFFVDIGPVWQRVEGDAGETFVVGGDREMLQARNDVRSIFEETGSFWHDHKTNGASLYHFAKNEASQRGWELNLAMSGHRLSDFPHAVKFDGSLMDIPYTPSSGLWVLEIQIRHPTRLFGAFYEDLLLDDKS